MVVPKAKSLYLFIASNYLTVKCHIRLLPFSPTKTEIGA